MPRMKFVRSFTALALPALLAGCLMRGGNYRNVETPIHEMDLPGPDYERKVFGPMPCDEMKDFVRQKESEGWRLVGIERASLPEDVMVDTTELDQPSTKKKREWSFDIPPTPTDDMDPPRPSIPPYLQDAVRNHRQKYLVILRRWL